MNISAKLLVAVEMYSVVGYCYTSILYHRNNYSASQPNNALNSNAPYINDRVIRTAAVPLSGPEVVLSNGSDTIGSKSNHSMVLIDPLWGQPHGRHS
jgi:hypothetical protein